MSNFFSQHKTTLLFFIIIAAAVIGLGDSVYLTATHYTGGSVTCSLIEGCNLVLGSSWATIGGIPVALLGAGYYGLLLAGIVGYFYTERPLLLSLLLAVSTVGLVISFAFLYLQLGVIEAVCEYCLLSLASTLVIWTGVLAILRQRDDTMEV